MARDFLLEIGVEELPHAFIDPARLQLAELSVKAFTEASLKYESLKVFSTPRRLTVLVSALDDEQKDSERIFKGPPYKAAFADGKATAAGEGFMRTQNWEICAEKDIAAFDAASKKDGLSFIEQGGQKFLQSYRYVKGRKTSEILPQLAKSLISSLTFAKTMRWADLDFPFARPIRFLLCLHGSEVVPFEIAGCISSNLTYGHPQLFKADEAVLVKNPSEYLSVLKARKVLADTEERKAHISSQLDQLEKTSGLKAIARDKVIPIVVNLTEWPTLILADFSESFLKVPREVLISEMVEHQKYFPLEDAAGKLVNKFVITSNIEKPENVIIGNRKVLTARLTDGAFLYDEDLKKGLEKMGEKLAAVTHQKDLGSLQDKVTRTRSAAAELVKKLALKNGAAVDEAASLMKNDLTSNMVYEFPELQGVMGEYYARAASKSAEVAAAIREHYMPLGSGAALPATDAGRILSLAEKFENLLGCYAAGLIPTGSADPYALRRQTFGIARILVDAKWNLDLPDLIASLAVNYQAALNSTKAFASEKEWADAVFQFIKSRLKTIFKDLGAESDIIEAALASNCRDIYELWRLADAAREFRKAKEFAGFAAVIKRAANILKDSKLTAGLNTKLLTESAEKELYAVWERLHPQIEAHIKSKNYLAAFETYSQFSAPMSAFFEQVLVNAEDSKIKDNRLAILQSISGLMQNLLDFGRIAV